MILEIFGWKASWGGPSNITASSCLGNGPREMQCSWWNPMELDRGKQCTPGALHPRLYLEWWWRLQLSAHCGAWQFHHHWSPDLPAGLSASSLLPIRTSGSACHFHCFYKLSPQSADVLAVLLGIQKNSQKSVQGHEVLISWVVYLNPNKWNMNQPKFYCESPPCEKKWRKSCFLVAQWCKRKKWME